MLSNIVIVITTGVVEYGGLTTVIMNYLKNMDLSGLKISLVSCNEIDTSIKSKFEKLNINYYRLASRKRKTIFYYQQLKKVLEKTKCDVIHVNGNSATMLIEMMAAKKVGVKHRISHCHTCKSMHGSLNKIIISKFNRSYTQAIAVSSEAGQWLYQNNNYTILKNAIEVRCFVYNLEVRMKYRDALNIQDRIVIGTIGKLNRPKNHNFILRVLKNLIKINKNFVFLLIGEGEERKNLQHYIEDNTLSENVLMIGARKDNAELLQAMDIFLFPSQFEGFGMALLEAEISGLPCLCSENIPKMTQICDTVEALPLNEGTWKKKILKITRELKNYNREEKSREALSIVEKEGFDIVKEASTLRCIYESILKGDK